MGINKVIYGGNTLIDISDTTASASDVISGKYFYDNSGTKTSGTASSGTVATAEKTPSSNSTSIKFSLSGQPKMFAIQISVNSGSYMTASSTRYITSVVSSGTSAAHITNVYISNKNGREYYYTNGTFSYSNGTLTVTSPGSSSGGYFHSGTKYVCTYIY